jgi:hypothetical protein
MGPFARTVAAIAAVTSAAGCASDYTIADRTRMTTSPASRTAAINLLPLPGQNAPDVSAHLAQALEMYQLQSRLLKERRNKVRARRRSLSTAAFGVGAAGLTATLGESLFLEDERQETTIGLTALVALGAATILKVSETIQEDTSSVDAKIGLLDRQYEAMLAELRRIQERLAVSGDAAEDAASQREASIQMSTVIETFIQEAQQINVKG